MNTTASGDRWATWLAERRHGGDREQYRRTLEVLAPVRDQVIGNAVLSPGSRMLDVGCGDGLIAFAGAEAVGPSGAVVFSDVSADLLNRCRALAADAGVLDRCSFVKAPARDLAPIADGSVDAVTVRSVLIYETDKFAAFAEFYRVLRPGGRLSLYEPINRFAFPEPPDRFHGYDVAPVAELMAKVTAVYDAIQPPGSDPMLDFDERDLVALAERAGFSELHLHLQADIDAPQPWPWPAWVNASGNPRVPTLAEVMAQVLTSAQADRVTDHLRPLVEHGEGQRRSEVAYLCAVR